MSPAVLHDRPLLATRAQESLLLIVEQTETIGPDRLANAVGAVRGLFEIDAALMEAASPGAPLRIGLVPGQ